MTDKPGWYYSHAAVTYWANEGGFVVELEAARVARNRRAKRMAKNAEKFNRAKRRVKARLASL